MFISMPYLSTASARLCVLGPMCQGLRLLRSCLCLGKKKGREGGGGNWLLPIDTKVIVFIVVG